jgi:hypothetical protein
MKNFFILLFIASLYCNIAFGQLCSPGLPWGYNAKTNTKIPAFVMPSIDIEKLKNEDKLNDLDKSIPLRFGQPISTNISTDNAGVWTTQPNGNKLWQLKLVCKNAVSINLIFDYFNIPKGATVFLYNEAKTQYIGALTHKNMQVDYKLGCWLLQGEAIIVEYYEPKNASFAGRLSIGTVTHGYRDGVRALKAYGDSGSCNNNANCPVGAAWGNILYRFTFERCASEWIAFFYDCRPLLGARS